MTRTDKLARNILKPINPSLCVVLGLYTIIWGLWIINPAFHVFGTAALYSAMAGIASEYIWGGIAILSGALVGRGAIKPSYANLQLGAFIGFFHWLVIAILYFLGDWMNTGGITALTFATYAAIIWVNVKVNRAYYDSLAQ